MGYDMTIEHGDPAVVARVDQLRTEFYALCKQRDEGDETVQERISELYGEMSEADTNYFRLNIFGMGTMRTCMDSLDMLAGSYVQPEWPDNVYDEITDKMTPEGEAYLAWSPVESGIPVHKLGSNDGWLVTPQDIRQALDLMSVASSYEIESVRAQWEYDGGNTWDEWIEFLERAEKYGGFRVY